MSFVPNTGCRTNATLYKNIDNTDDTLTAKMVTKNKLRRVVKQHRTALRLAFVAVGILVLSSHPTPCSGRSLQFKSQDCAAFEDGGWSIMGYSARMPSLLKSYAANKATIKSCSENYGFLPCSTTLGGNLFLVVVYGFLMLKAAELLSDGSDMLLAVINPGIIGGLVLPILGASPDALLILISGVTASKENAKSQILVGMGLLAGSTVMLLTIVWGSCLIVGRCDLQEVGNGKMMMKPCTLTKKFSLYGTGISMDSQSKTSAWIMIVSVLPFIVVQIPKLFGYPVTFPFKVTSCILAIIGLLGYCSYQVISPWLQERRITMARERYQQFLSVKRLSQFSYEKWGGLLNSDGSPDENVLAKLFNFADKDKDQKLSESEVRGLIIGLGLPDALTLHGIETDNVVDKWMSEFDIVEADRALTKEEFIAGMSRWIKSAIKWSKAQNKGEQKPVDRILSHAANDAELSLQALLDKNADDGEGKDDEQEETESLGTKQLVFRAVLKIAVGAGMAAIFADPLVDAIDRFSTVSGMPSFFVSFVASPFATNFSEAVSSFMFASKKSKQHLSLAYSQIYGSVTMNNTLCLGVFLLVVLLKRVAWDFSSEVLVIVVVTLIMGLFSVFKVTFPLWMAIFTFFLYPVSIALVVILDYVFGWQ